MPISSRLCRQSLRTDINLKFKPKEEKYDAKFVEFNFDEEDLQKWQHKNSHLFPKVMKICFFNNYSLIDNSRPRVQKEIS